MKNCDKSSFSPNPLQLSCPSLEEYENHLPTISVMPHSSNTDFTSLGIQSFNHGVGGSNVDGRIGEVPFTRPRGRPRGSKNKSKLGIEKTVPMKVAIYEIPPKADVIEWVGKFAESKKLCVTILNGSGSVSLVDVKNATTEYPPVTFYGHFTLISLSGTFLYASPSASSLLSSPLPSSSFVTASLASFDGQLFGGVALKMVAMTPVVLTMTTFSNPEIYGQK